ncbi:hypothetical protein [Muricauda brasiliensis]|uniref:hypothetical protein n=1 Tax=Muricauda brasiliensis TaxID=2162892 RepID=UPI00131EF9F1|nr:hypothetical protein [Muricauda brasiliensis]
MKTINFINKVLLSFVMVGLSAQAQTKDTGIETKQMVENSLELFKQLSNDIALDEEFNYRKELKASRAEQTMFYFRDIKVSKTQLLRYFKRAARSSDNSIQFKTYFLERQLYFINKLDRKTLSGVYDAMRSKTLNGYLDILAVFAATDQIMPTMVRS